MSRLPARSSPSEPRGSEVVLAGRSNVGKSTLVNAIVGRTVAAVAKRPGKTQRPGRIPWQAGSLVDLPGYGFARAPREARDAWKREVEEFFFHAENLAGAVLVVDARTGATDSDREMIDLLRHEGLPFVVAANKCDRLSGNERARAWPLLIERLALPPDSAALWTSGRDGEGIRELRRAIGALLAAGPVAA